ncbi:MAG: cobalamin-dependent protein, partial [Elusimicrobiota bacterium]
MSMKIALISPGRSSRFAVQEPLNLGYIASYLIKHGYNPIIIDQLAGDNIEEKLSSFKPDIVGITATTPVIYHAYRVADYCRQKGILTVIGGVHATFFQEEAIEHADIVVKREGELAMLDIVEGRIKSGIVEGKFIENINDIPPPARHLMRMDKYLYCKKNVPYILHLPYVQANKRIIHILTSRGCPHSKCIFCHNSLKGIPYRMNSPDFVIE